MKRSNGERKTNPQEYRHRKRGREEEVRVAASQGTEGQEDIVDKSKHKKNRGQKRPQQKTCTRRSIVNT